MRPRRLPPLLAALALALALAAPAPAAAQDGPPLAAPPEALAAALDCPRPLARAGRAPVLLIPGTNLEPRANFDWNYEPALDAAGVPWCALTLPRHGMGDIQDAAEYVVAALRRMAGEARRRVSIVGYSQGGMIGRWALRWWPDTRALVEDLVGLAPSNHGTAVPRATCASSCPPSYWQQRDDSGFVRALNSQAETWEGIDYTVAYTRYDEVVTPNADDETGSSALRTGQGRIANVALQDVCPGNSADHLAIGTYDPVAWALALDALTNDGPAEEGRVPRTACLRPFMPGVDPAAFPANWARFNATVGEGSAQSEYVAAEPPVRCYAAGTCLPEAAVHRDAPAVRCARRRTFELRLDRRLRSARVTVDGRRARVRRRGGRLVATIRLARGGRAQTVRVRGERADGRRLSYSRRYRLCR